MHRRHAYLEASKCSLAHERWPAPCCQEAKPSKLLPSLRPYAPLLAPVLRRFSGIQALLQLLADTLAKAGAVPGVLPPGMAPGGALVGSTMFQLVLQALEALLHSAECKVRLCLSMAMLRVRLQGLLWLLLMRRACLGAEEAVVFLTECIFTAASSGHRKAASKAPVWQGVSCNSTAASNHLTCLLCTASVPFL